MGKLLPTFAFFWISAGFLLGVEARSQIFPFFPPTCEFHFRDVCFELVEFPTNWFEAQSICEEHGGELLSVMNEPVEDFLNNIRGNRSTNIGGFWLGKEIEGIEQTEFIEYHDAIDEFYFCPYIRLNPLQVETFHCDLLRGFLCTYILQPSFDNENPVHIGKDEIRPRLRRQSKPDKFETYFREADQDLLDMEQLVGSLTRESADEFIRELLNITENLELSGVTNESINHLLNCSSAILVLALKRCDVKKNPNPPSLFEDIFEVFRRVGVVLGKDLSQMFVIYHPSGTMYQTSKPPQEIGDLVLGSVEDGEAVVFPPFSAMQSFLEPFPTVTASIASFRHNPHPTHEKITGTVCSVTLSDGDSEIRVTGLTERIEIFLARSNVSELESNSVVLEKDTKSVTLMNISDANTTVFFTVEPSSNVTLFLNLSYGSPNNSYFSANTTIVSDADGYRWVITPEMLRFTPGIWYIDAQLHNSQWEPNLTLTITSFMTKCMYWDKDQEKWSVEGCIVGDQSTPQLTQCLCNHLTLFGSSFFVMPNHVDISKTAELFATVNQNYVVLALLCAFYGLYLITLIWACFADRKARHKRKMTLLEDNHPGAQYNYLVSVQTGNRKNAGTSSNVTLMLVGAEGESRIHNLSDPDKPVFCRGSVDMFLLATPFPLGEIQNIRLQHDNSGGNPSWYIHKVVIQDLQTHGVWHFLCNCWLSTDRGDNTTKKTFNVANIKEIACFRNIFRTRTSTGFRDEHIWVSIVDPPSRSPFTRAQRVSCCMSLLLCTMVINIAFWNVSVNDTSQVIFAMGAIEITWKEFMIGVQSGLLMFPINILIITIFRSIRPRIVSKSKDEENNVTQPTVTLPSVLKETEEVFTLMSKSPRNKGMEETSLESSADLLAGLDKLHTFVQVMQGESESDSHSVNCSRFLLATLCKLLMDLEKVDAKHFSSPAEHQQVLSLTNLLVRKTEMVFSAHLTACPPPPKKKKSWSYWLPWWCVFLGWFLLLAIAVISTFFTLLYGFQYGRDKSIKWVMSLGLSLFQSIFILQPLKVIGLAVFFALLLKPVAVEESEEVEHVLLEQQKKCSQYCGRATL